MVCGGSGRVLKLVCGWLCLYEIRKTNQVLYWVRLLVALFAGPKISACHGQWAMNYLVRDTALFLHLLLLAFGQSKKYRFVFFLFSF